MMSDVIGMMFQMVDNMAPKPLKEHFRQFPIVELTSEDLLRERTLQLAFLKKNLGGLATARFPACANPAKYASTCLLASTSTLD